LSTKKTKQRFFKDNLHKKIKKHIEQKTEKLKRKISDSLKQYTKGKPVNGDVVKYLLKRKQVLMEDSWENYMEPLILQILLQHQ
jgi:hypothetical protein